MSLSRKTAGRWTDVTVGDTVVGYVYPRTTSGPTQWGGVVEKDGRTGEFVGWAKNKTEAVALVTAAYLRS